MRVRMDIWAVIVIQICASVIQVRVQASFHEEDSEDQDRSMRVLHNWVDAHVMIWIAASRCICTMTQAEESIGCGIGECAGGQRPQSE